MKHRLGVEAVEKIALGLAKITPNFNVEGFKNDAMKGLNELELKARIHHLIAVLNEYLPEDFEQTADILMAVGKDRDNNGLSGFGIWCLIDYVGIYGLGHAEKALDVLEILTPLFSAEFAIRPFINEHFELTYERLTAWCKHDDEHLRRLASEGMRPRLPWGLQLKQFIDDPSEVIKLLEILKDDEAEYVRRSVANNLNDISKDHPELVVELCKKWLKKPTENRQWISKHATRGLVKKGYPPVFALLGYSEKLDVEIDNFRIIETRVEMGEYLQFEFDLNSNIEQKFIVDFAIHFMKSNGKTAPKVFKLKNVQMSQGQCLTIEKKQIFKPISTRKYYAGKHMLEILLNGESHAILPFELHL